MVSHVRAVSLWGTHLNLPRVRCGGSKQAVLREKLAHKAEDNIGTKHRNIYFTWGGSCSECWFACQLGDTIYFHRDESLFQYVTTFEQPNLMAAISEIGVAYPEMDEKLLCSYISNLSKRHVIPSPPPPTHLSSKGIFWSWDLCFETGVSECFWPVFWMFLTKHSTRKTLLLLLRIQRYTWWITTPHYFPLSQAQDDLQRGIPVTNTLGAICCSHNAASPWATWIDGRTHDPGRNNNRASPLDLEDSTIATTHSTLYVANHHATLQCFKSARLGSDQVLFKRT